MGGALKNSTFSTPICRSVKFTPPWPTIGITKMTWIRILLVDGRGLWAPSAVAIDGSVTPNRVYVADTNNNRVLAWAQVGAFTNADPADLVIGQPDFFSFACNNGGVSANSLCDPLGVAVDVAGNLYVADFYNTRVLEYDTPLTSGTTADRVFGPGGRCVIASADSLCFPQGVAVDGVGNLYVADTDDNRVLKYDTPLTSGTTADGMLGQVSFALDGANLVDARGLIAPSAVAIDRSVTPNRIYVADTNNSRVLAWKNAAAFTNADPADLVIGQPDVLSFGCRNGGVSANSLCFPQAVAVDGAGNLYVADESNNRVLEYDTPLTSDTTADRVFGQGGNFASGGCNNGGVSADSLCHPRDVAVDGAGNLYVADTDNHRVLEYNGPLSVCGNGLVESGESCDDGNTANGDCCSSACQLEPDGTTCDDGNSCTSSDACQSGMCTGACQVGTVCGSGCDGTLRCALNGSTCSCR